MVFEKKKDMVPTKNPKEDVTTEDLSDPVLFQVGFLNTEPFDKQITVLKSKAKHKVLCCGRRGGKTRLIAGELIRGALFGIYPRQLVATPVYKNIRPIFNQVIRYLEDTGLIADTKKVIHTAPQHILWKNKSVIDFGSCDTPDSLRGEAYDRIFKDEAGFIKDGADAVLRPMMFDTDADLWETSTPWKKNTFYDNYMLGQNPENKERIESFHWTSLDNPHLQTKVIQDEIEKYGESSFYVQSEIYGQFIDDIDSFFKQSLVDACIDTGYSLVNEDKLISI